MKRKISPTDPAALAREIAALAEASTADLKHRWRSLYGTEPPPRVSRELLTRATAYRLQESVYGGLKASTRRLLERVAEDASAHRPVAVKPTRKASPGTVLIREWQGAAHQVTVLEDGVVYRGKRYRSLSEVARLITGARWSGPLFFGLKGQGREACDGAR